MKLMTIGEMRVSEKGLVHGDDFCKALNAERIKRVPKDVHDVRVVVGRLLGGKKPATLVEAEARGAPTVTVDDMLDQATGKRLLDLLQKKEKLEPYEAKAIVELTLRWPTTANKKRRSKKVPTKVA